MRRLLWFAFAASSALAVAVMYELASASVGWLRYPGEGVPDYPLVAIPVSAYFLPLAVVLFPTIVLMLLRGLAPGKALPSGLTIPSAALLVCAASFLYCASIDGGESANSLPEGALAMSYPREQAEWQGSQIWMAPTVIVTQNQQSASDYLVFGMTPALGKKPVFTIWASGEGHDFTPLGNSCARSGMRELKDGSTVTATGLWCEMNSDDERLKSTSRYRTTEELIPGLEASSPVVIEIGGDNNSYKVINPAGSDGTRMQVAFSSLLTGSEHVFDPFREQPIDGLTSKVASIHYQSGVDGAPAGIVNGSMTDGFGLGAGFYMDSSESVTSSSGSVGQQQGHILLYYADQQPNPAGWVAGWTSQSRSGHRWEDLLQNAALVVLGGVPLISFAVRRRRIGNRPAR